MKEISLIDKGRTLHMIGVAEYMYNNADSYGLPRDICYLTGYLHDIGYLYGKPNHERNGYELLLKEGILELDVANAILWHGTTPQEFVELCMEQPSDLLVLLWEADMSVDLTGNNVGFEKRLKDIKQRYGEDSNTYEICKDTVVWLIQNRDNYTKNSNS